MKNRLLFPFLFLLAITAYSQEQKYRYTAHIHPVIKREELVKANYASEVAGLWHNLSIPSGTRSELENRKRLYYILPQENNYNKLVDYLSVIVFVTSEGKDLSAKSTGNKLSEEQKNLLSRADLGSDIRMTVKFKYKNMLAQPEHWNDEMEGFLTLTVLPETEAQYPGGPDQLTRYLNEEVFNKIGNKKTLMIIKQVAVKFIVSVDGQTVGIRLSRSSNDLKTDQLVLQAIKKMPKWKPAKNAKDIPVNQYFVIPFGNADGC